MWRQQETPFCIAFVWVARQICVNSREKTDKNPPKWRPTTKWGPCWTNWWVRVETVSVFLMGLWKIDFSTYPPYFWPISGETTKYQVKFNDQKVCKSFLLGCCPHEILTSTVSPLFFRLSLLFCGRVISCRISVFSFFIRFCDRSTNIRTVFSENFNFLNNDEDIGVIVLYVSTVTYV